MTLQAKKIHIGIPIVLILIISLLVALLSHVSINKTKNLLVFKSYSKLTTSRDIKKQQVINFFSERISNIKVLAKSSDITILINTLNNYLQVNSKEQRSVKKCSIKKIVSPHENFLLNYSKEYGYMNMLIICSRTGKIIYTQKQTDILGKTIKNTLFKESGLHEVWEKTIKLKRVVLADIKAHKESESEPAMLMGAPIYIDGKLKSVLILQISDVGLSEIMDFREGYGKTQEDYLVGSDNLMRNNYICPLNSTNGKCDTEVTLEVLEGRVVHKIVKSYSGNGNPVLSAYSPININKDLQWAILSEIDEKEVLIVPNKIKDTIILYSLLFIVIIIAIILFIIYKVFKYEQTEAKKSQDMYQNLRKINKELSESEYEVILKNEKLEIKVDEEITKNKENQELLFQQSKMASMGEMIGNIAHQWRQPLNALSALNVGLSMKYDAGKLSKYEMIQFKEKSNHLVQRMSSTIDDFRNFFYPNKERELFRVDKAIDEAINFINSAYSINNIKLINYSSSKIEIKNHRNELIQVLLNIFNNSKDAIKEFNPENGVVIVDIHMFQENIEITIQDNGGGIKQEIIDRVFEPYFTTKFKDDGTGIGLYMSKMIIEESMNGKLRLENRENGVLVTIQLSIRQKHL